MTGYGQFCAIARAHEVLGGRWTLLVVRELLMGSRRFNDIRRGIPRISRTMLSERLHALTIAGVVRRRDGAQGPEYELTESGREIGDLLGQFARWGQRWLPRHAAQEDLDAEPLLIDMQRRVRLASVPRQPLVIRLDIGRGQPRFLRLSPSEASLCSYNPGFPELLRIRSPLAALIAWWRGDASFAEAQRMGLSLEGSRTLIKSFPGWFDRYLFAGIRSMHADKSPSAPRPRSTVASVSRVQP
jgi:DNA-binding HxlR family transcriptional regulator